MKGPEQLFRPCTGASSPGVSAGRAVSAVSLPARAAIAGAVAAPLALWRIVRLADHADRAAFERLTFFAVFLLVATTACQLAAFTIP